MYIHTYFESPTLQGIAMQCIPTLHSIQEYLNFIKLLTNKHTKYININYLLNMGKKLEYILPTTNFLTRKSLLVLQFLS